MKSLSLQEEKSMPDFGMLIFFLTTESIKQETVIEERDKTTGKIIE
ncbi:MAG: hypothetical protein KAQ95_01395 [Candidatus Heimdallarchaeota archaeon]|nr:hypothetical protein [Candidatus Heimdallarchaeota archaeon]